MGVASCVACRDLLAHDGVFCTVPKVFSHFTSAVTTISDGLRVLQFFPQSFSEFLGESGVLHLRNLKQN